MNDDLNYESMIPEHESQKKDSKKKIGFLVLGIVVVVILIIVFVIWRFRTSAGAKTEEDVTVHFLEALGQQDPDEMYALLSPAYIRYMEDEGSIFGMTPKSDVEDQMDFFFEDLRDYYEIGKYKRLFYDEDDIEMQKYRGDDLAEMQEYFREEFEMEIDAFTQVNITLQIEGTKGKATVPIELFLFRVGKKWYYIDWYWY